MKDETGRPPTLTERTVKAILMADMLLHFIVAAVLIMACFVITVYAFAGMFPVSRESVMHVTYDMLLILIILELLWTVVRFLKKKKFSIAPFLSIGIIAAIRRILMIEMQTSMLDHVPTEKLYEIGLSALVVLALMVAYFIAYKSSACES
jgi:uncharacterized membrane protein (DUF373 family)